MTEAEHILINRAVRGDREALAALVERVAPVLRPQLDRMIPDRWRSLLAVDDVLQQAYTDALLGIDTFESRGEGSFTAWLATLARNNLLNAVRMFEADKRGGGRQRVEVMGAGPSDDSFVGLFELIGAVSRTPSREIATREAKSAILATLDRLPATYHTVIRRYDLDGAPIEVVAAEIGRSEGATYMLRSRAHRLLAELMGAASNYFSMSP